MNFGDIIAVDCGNPIGSEAGFIRPAVVITADGFLRYRPSTILVVLVTTTERSFPSHVEIASDTASGRDDTSWALVEQLRAVAVERCGPPLGNVGPVVAQQLLEIVAMMTGMP
jgi:mRNA interferase MazF